MVRLFCNKQIKEIKKDVKNISVLTRDLKIFLETVQSIKEA